MNLPASQQRALSQIEKTLADDHPGLGPLFAIFTRVAGQEPMPVTERVTDRSWRLPWQRRLRWPRRMWPTAAGVVGLAMMAVVLFTLSLTLPSRPACTGTTDSIAARIQAAPTGSQAACATQQSDPAKTGPARAGSSHAKSVGGLAYSAGYVGLGAAVVRAPGAEAPTRAAVGRWRGPAGEMLAG